MVKYSKGGDKISPRIVAIAGPLKTASFELTDEPFSIGRDASNRLVINDLSVSRQHCLISREAGLLTIKDRGSHNGTFVNGVPVNEHVLKHGDQVGIGNSLFHVLLYDSEIAPRLNAVEVYDGALATKSVIKIRVEDDLNSVARDLAVLMKLSQSINAVGSIEALQEQLLELFFEVIPAQRGAVLLIDDSLDAPRSFYGIDKQGGAGQAVRISRTVTQQALDEGTGLLSNEVAESKAFGAANSLITSHICSFICVPLLSGGRRLGVIYFDTSEHTERFSEGDLRLVTASANIVAVAIDNIRRMEWLVNENQRLRSDIQVEHKMIGESAPMRKVYQFIERLTHTDSTVLIRGESGTGKELVARAIHDNSARQGKPFVAVNCAALTESLLESELFGHEKGAFTGAIGQKKGKVEVADGGTIFLDEIGEMALVLQAKLLRVLQEREFERVGGTRPLKVDVRLIAATNKDLEAAITRGEFRQDLYYRLNVVTVKMPPLRERREDIQLLASYFATKYSVKCKRHLRGISAEARACLSNYAWPGNVRELENAIERAVVLGLTEYILPEDLPEAVLEEGPPPGGATTRYHEAVYEAKRRIILSALEQSGGNYADAARSLGMHPNNLQRLVRSMNLRSALKK